MKRGDIPGLTFGTILGVLFTFIFILFLFKSTAIADVLFGVDDNKLIQSLDGLEKEIYEIGLGEEKDILFYFSEDTKAVLMAFNLDPGNPTECYGSPCIVVCDNENCDNDYVTIPLSEDIEFLNSGLIFDLSDVEGGLVSLTVKNDGGKISIRPGRDCTGLADCGDYEEDLFCRTDPCGVGPCYIQLIPRDFGASVEVCSNK